MTETPTEETTSKGRSAYLAALPIGWTYEVTLLSADRNTKIVVGPTPGRDQYAIAVVSEGKPRNTLVAEDLADAARTAVKAAKSLAKITEKEQELATERAALLEALGGTEGLVDVAALNALAETPAGVNVESRGGKGVTVGLSDAANAKDIATGLGDEPARRRPMARGGLPASVESVDTDA